MNGHKQLRHYSFATLLATSKKLIDIVNRKK